MLCDSSQAAPEFPALHQEQDHREPDHAESRELGMGEGFVVDEDADEELDGGRDVLQDADHGQRDAMRGGSEQDQGGGGDQSCAHEQEV